MFSDILDEEVVSWKKRKKGKFEIYKLENVMASIFTDSHSEMFVRIKKIFDACSEYHGRMFLCGGWLRYFLNPHIKHDVREERHSNLIGFLKKTKPLRATILAGDIDIYCKDQEAYDGIKKIFRYKLHVLKKFETENAITYKPNTTLLPPIQLIKPMIKGKMVTMGSLEEILSNFDFTVIRVGMDHDLLEKSQALIDVDFVRDELNHNIVIKNVSSMQRVIKYCKKGYN